MAPALAGGVPATSRTSESQLIVAGVSNSRKVEVLQMPMQGELGG